MKKHITALSGVLLAVAFVAMLGVLAFRTPSAFAQLQNDCSMMVPSTVGNVHGWMWSSTVGWGSLNCKDLMNLFPGVPKYTVKEDTQGYWTGQAWFSTVGWLRFGGLNCTDYGIAGSDASSLGVGLRCNLRKMQNGDLRGWAKFDAGTSASNANGICQQNPNPSPDITVQPPYGNVTPGCWDGLVSFSSENDSNFKQAGAQYSTIKYGAREALLANAQNQKLLSGFAWGSSVVGWLGFCNQSIEIMKSDTPTTSTGDVDGPVPATQLGGQVIGAPYSPTSNLDFSARCNSYVDGVAAPQPNQNSIQFWDYGPYCPASYGTAELDWNLNGPNPSATSCTLYFGSGNGNPVMQNISGDGVYTVPLPSGAGLYHMECTNPQGSFSENYTVTALSASDPLCTTTPTGPGPGPGTTTSTTSQPPTYSVDSNDSGLCFNQSTSVITWLATASNGVGFDSCRVLDGNQQIVASGLPTHGTGGASQPYLYDVPGVGSYTVECKKTGTSGANQSDWVTSLNTHTFQACQNSFSFNTSAVALCPGNTATLSWNAGSAVTCTTNGTFSTTQLPPQTQSGSKNGIGPGTYTLSCDYANPNETLTDSITITQLSAGQCVPPTTGTTTGTGTTTVGKPGVHEF